MKLKSALATISVSLLALVLVIVFSAPTAAQKTAGQHKAPDKAVSKKAAGGQDQSEGKVAKTVKTPAPGKPQAAKKPSTAPQDADYWFDKGALCATYGNDRAAIKYFQKAIALDPNRSGAYFEQGISHGQLGEFDKALDLVNKAIEMEPQNGLYLYGRGRIYLISGQEDPAMVDFNKAAGLDDEDAQAYLDNVVRREPAE
jgi:tetratricopeptide (TPR) repeat protein